MDARTLIDGVLVVLLWAAVAGKVPALRRHPDNRALRAYWLALLALALAVTVLLPPIQLALDRTTVVPNLARLLGHSLALGCACAASVFLLFSSYPEATAQARARRRVWALAVTLLLMGGLFAAAKVRHETLDFLGHYGTATLIVVYWLVFLTYLGVALVDVVRLAWRWAGQTDQAVLGLGLRLTAIGGLIGLAYVGYDLLYLAAAQLERPNLLGNQPLMTQGLIAASVVLIVVGSTMPAWGPRVGLPTLLGWLGRYRAHRRLYPLWWALCQAIPGIALVPPPSRWRDALSVRNLGFALHRRIIEMRDAQLQLRPFLDPQAAETATELGRQAGLEGEELRVVAVAASLSAALHAKVEGQRAAGAGSALADPGGTDVHGDLESESAWWVKVATAYRSPLVRDVMSQQRATVPRRGTGHFR
jgi:hypothetical protein